MIQPTTEVTNPAAATADVHSTRPRPYKVASVEKTGTPDGGQGQDWYRYTLESGRSTITGQRRGLRQDVLAYAEQCTEQLNSRGFTALSIWNPRGKKPVLPT